MEHQPSRSVLYLWPRRTLHVGRPGRAIQFSQAAASLTVSLDAPFRVRTPTMVSPVPCTSLLLRPGEKATVDPGTARVGTCYLDALGQDYRLLLPQMRAHESGLYRGFVREAELRDLCELMLNAAKDDGSGFEALEHVINPEAEPYPDVDPRVAAVVAMIRDSVAENRSVKDLAEAVNLSVPRLVQLFRQQVGVPIRRYRQWHRLFVTAINVARGRSLTDAAIQAGFTDSAHFSHTFRATLGLRPSEVLSELVRTRLVVPADLSADTGVASSPAQAGA
ncbi:helix-turn-helix transcriptional regulator [Marinobacter salinisoli]|uniref:Helix-turn-helix transcriptional regulator n=1 Tax=Marinobacter salinisoli TaxID=2769486 RepID=A0ABX7MPR3_9GAMM|nr:AraC family transcriptional regulator [Marinobacter salinisoli]QSP94320.1 helix-turn-helix transcriptional regulator [Marinobacter salinisoli]